MTILWKTCKRTCNSCNIWTR